MTPGKFDEQLGSLREIGFQSITLAEIAGGADLSKKIAITFDDGRTSVFENAMEPLARHGLRAIQFIVADMIGRTNEWDTIHDHMAEPLMNTTQIREWLAAGHEIGSHSMTHRNLTKLDDTSAREQIFDSKKKLEDQFGIEVRHFCYPHGKWNEKVRDLVAEAGYATACTTCFGVNTTATPRFQLNRIPALTGRELMMKTADRLRRKLGL
ncbi:MAG: polysaccharide deacetylase family protein [Chthoniobacteraceae bacterium]